MCMCPLNIYRYSLQVAVKHYPFESKKTSSSLPCSREKQHRGHATPINVNAYFTAINTGCAEHDKQSVNEH